MSGIDRFSVTCAAYLGGLATLVLVGLSFENLSSGLANSSSDGPFFCRTLESSGGDDDAVVFVFVLFALPFLATLLLGAGGYSLDAWMLRRKARNY